ncbi:MAG TPA: putative metal-dependent hydrolase [Bryobacteraceae bacterium]|nr:putative metal-dependent hydrolase [Bryobacteraceae bacterium]
MDTPDLRYPVGKFQFPETVSPDERAKFVAEIAEAPFRLREVVKGLGDAELDTPYRPGGWTVRQVVHHVPDSHINSYIRFRWALTEEEPTIKAYHEDRWAELPDARTAPVEVSLKLLESLHSRWVGLLRSLTDEDWKRTFRHPSLGLLRLEQNAALYAWHGRHHVAHIAALRERMGWK